MPLSPLDIHNKEFHRSFRGYNEQEVDEFLDRVVHDFEALIRENNGLREQVQAMSSKLEHYRQLEETLHNTLIVAQETAEEVKAAARKEAELIVREAQLEADRVIKAGEERVRELQDRYEQLQKHMQVFRAKMRSLLESQLELLAGDWGEDDGAVDSLPLPRVAVEHVPAGLNHEPLPEQEAEVMADPDPVAGER